MRNPWKAFLVGLVGGAAGTFAMRYYWKAVKDYTGEDPRRQTNPTDFHALDDISLIGRHHKEGESPTAAMGRIIYHYFTGKDPETQETKRLLSYLVHWGYGIIQGGMLGIFSRSYRKNVIESGATYGFLMWLVGDELATGMIGLSKGPTTSPLGSHVHYLGAHLLYGVTAALVGKTLYKVI